jgi:hypothetical protein
MSVVGYLRHWLSGAGTRLQVIDFVPESDPIRQWADTFPWEPLVDAMGIPVRRDNLVSAMYSTGLNSTTSLVTPQRTDRHGILDQKPSAFQLLS